MQMTAQLNQSITEEQIQMIKNTIESIQSGKRAEAERARQIEKSRNELLARDLEARKAAEAVRPCLADRIWEGIVTAYAVVYGTIFTIAEKLVVREDD